VDVAQLAGVSPATVSFVLNQTAGQTISEETRPRELVPP
jgi:LacI family transcriptional regulator